MGGDHQFYGGATDYMKPAEYGESFVGYQEKAGVFGLTTDPRSANQIKAVSDKLNTGAKVVEITAISAELLENIPNQHLDEIRRLKELTGSEITFHGPLVEATGISQQGWDESRREQAERQMWSAVDRSHKIDPKGNIVVTFHTTSGLPEMLTRVKGENGEEAKEMWIIDEREGKFVPIKPKPDYFNNEKNPKPEAELAKLNKENWEKSLSAVNFHAYQGKNALESVENAFERSALPEEVKNEKAFFELYAKAGTPDGQKFMERLRDSNPGAAKIAEKMINDITYADIHVRDAYLQLQNLFNQAYSVAESTSDDAARQRLNEYREHIKEKTKNLEDPKHVAELATEVQQGIKLLSTIQPPKVFRPLNEFAMDKASDTFSNVAFSAFKKFKDTAPIISIENPPAGSGLSRGEDIKKLIEETRGKFVKKAHEELGLSEKEARQQAEKLIGVTWDVGHINMIRKYGYNEKDVVKETEKIAPFIKHVHLSDNFGLEHTELPMGMGNVPIKEHLELIKKYNDKAKKIIETGPWYQHFQRSPLPETLAAFGSPIYGMKMAPYWSNVRGLSGGYFSGYGMNPDIHHSLYGSGFSGLPVELGGQIAGRSRLSGAPME